MPHIIKRQLIDLQLNDDSNAFRIQHLFGEHYRNEIVPILEAVFSEYCGEDEVLVLEKLELDLGTITEAELEKSRLEDALLAAFRLNLRENMTAVSIHKRYIRRTLPMNSCMQWLSYMRTGHLPWNTLLADEGWYQSVLETLATDHSAVALLRSLITGDIRSIRRIVLQHDPVFLRKLVEILTAQNQQQLPSAIEDIVLVVLYTRRAGGGPPLRGELIGSLWQEALLTAAGPGSDRSATAIAVRLLQPYIAELPLRQESRDELIPSLTVLDKVVDDLVLAAMKKSNIPSGDSVQPKVRKADNSTPPEQQQSDAGLQPADDLPAAPGENSETQQQPKRGQAAQRKKKVDKKNTAREGDEPGLAAAGEKSAGDIDDTDHVAAAMPGRNSEMGDLASSPGLPDRKDAPLSGHSVFRPIDDGAASPLNKIMPEEGIFVRNAGIVLTYPFLAFLFRRLSWVEKNAFVDAETRVKAVFLLHWLATGETTVAEYDLVMGKLLCGYPLDEPLPLAMDFTDEQLREATDMLEALIGQWSRMQNTSIAGLREGFLQRGGKLMLHDAIPLIQVESGAIDILLKYLPLDLSWFKLPWMDSIVRVKW